MDARARDRWIRRSSSARLRGRPREGRLGCLDTKSSDARSRSWSSGCSMRAANGLIEQSRRPDSNRGPLHYEGKTSEGRASTRGHARARFSWRFGDCSALAVDVRARPCPSLRTRFVPGRSRTVGQARKRCARLPAPATPSALEVGRAGNAPGCGGSATNGATLGTVGEGTCGADGRRSCYHRSPMVLDAASGERSIRRSPSRLPRVRHPW
jgi:hypothetical protein